MAQIKSVREALNDFKKSGKFVLAYANFYTQKEYYLNSVANTIYLNPIGEMEFKGFLPGLGMIEKTLVNTNLPMTMKAFCKRAQGL